MTKPSSFLPELVEQVFSRIEKDLEQPNKNLSDRDYLELYSLFGNTLERALHTLDTTKIVLYQQQDKIIELVEIPGRNRRVYKLFPDVNYCPCPSFLIDVLTHKRAYTCKHILAVKLGRILGKLEVHTLTNDQINFMVKQVNN